jgi:hypothetical protein
MTDNSATAAEKLYEDANELVNNDEFDKAIEVFILHFHQLKQNTS